MKELATDEAKKFINTTNLDSALDELTESDFKQDMVEKKEVGGLENASTANGDIQETENETALENNKNVPVDRGWAWVILFAAYLEVVIFGGLMKCYGVFFIVYQERFKSSASETSLILTIQNMTMSFTGIFVMTIGMKYMTARTSVLIGAVLHSLFYIVTAFAENIAVLYFTVGFIPGLAGAMIYLPIISTINTYFNKYRGLANSITMSGSSLGGLAFGPLYIKLFEEYGYTGTMLLLSGILLHIVISGVLLRPIEFYTRHQNRSVYNVDDHRETKEKLISISHNRLEGSQVKAHGDHREQTSLVPNAHVSLDENGIREGNYVTKEFLSPVQDGKGALDDMHIMNEIKRKNIIRRDFSRTVSYDPERLINRHFPSPSLKRAKLQNHDSNAQLSGTSAESVNETRKRTFSDISHSGLVHGVVQSLSRSRVALYASGDVLWGSLANINSANFETLNPKHDHTEVQPHSGTAKSHIKRRSSVERFFINFLKTVFDVTLLKSYVFIHFLCFAFFILPGSVLPTVYFAPYAKEIGISSTEIGTMFAIIGCLDMVSRIALGFIADKKLMKPTSILGLTTIIVGTTSHLIRFFTNYGTLMIFVVIIGITSGAYMSLYAVVMLEHMGADKFKGALGWATMCHGVTMAAFFPITGAMRDETGEYLASFHLIGILLYLAAALSFTLPCTHKKAQNNKDST